MDKSFSFSLSDDGILSKSLGEYLDIKSFLELCNYIHQLPYGRNSNRYDLELVLKEEKGTCSSKHAFLKQIAIEHDFKALTLWIGIYKMNNKNTKGIDNVLKINDLNYIPEAHCYLKYENKRMDLTFPNNDKLAFEDSLITEKEIIPEQINRFKIDFHQEFIKNWIQSNQVSYSFEEVWHIRERCIVALEQKKARSCSS